MKKKIIVSLILLIFGIGFAQDWVQQTTTTNNLLTRVRFINAMKGFAIGAGGGGVLLRTTNGGENWIQIPLGVSSNLGGISFCDELNGIIVGSDGVILRTTDGGDTWVQQFFDTSGLWESHLQAVHMFDTNNGVASGCWGLTIRTTDGGTNWIRNILPTQSWFSAMYFPTAQTGYIGGGFPGPTNGEVFKTTDSGATWFPVFQSVPTGLWGIYFFNENVGLVSGIGKIYRTTNGGTSWTDHSVPEIAGCNMDGISFGNESNGFMVGYSLGTEQGKMLRSTDGGITWVSHESGVTDILTDVYMVNTNSGWAVGGRWPVNSRIIKYNPEIINTNLLVPILSYPRGGQTVYSLSPTMNWYLYGNNTGLTGYELQYATTLTDFNTVATKVVISSPGTYNAVLSNLQPGTTYYWRMRSTAANNNFSLYSGIESFVTYGTPGGVIVPVPSWPRWDSYVYTLTPELKWYLTSTPVLPLKYEIKFGTNADLSGGTVINNITDLQTVLPRLAGNTRYYWAVRSYNGTIYSDFSEIVSFRTQPNLEAVVPIISWPRMGAMVYSITPQLSWYLPVNVSNLTYKVKFSTDPANSAGVQYIDNISGLSAVTPNLTNGTTYYWQVCSFDGVNYSAYSPVESFVVYGSVGPEIPVASWPRDNNILYLNNTKFDWYMPTSSQGITSYSLQYSLDAGFGSATTIDNITEQYKYVTGLLPGTTYYWRVKAYKGALASGWSTTAVFRTESSSGSGSSGPTPAAAGWPRGGATMYTNNPQLNWYLTNSHVGIVSFLLKYSTSPTMAGAISHVFPVTQFSTTLTGLTYGQTYYWTIQSYDGTTYSTFNPPESFVIYVPGSLKSTQYLPVPLPVSPAFGNLVYRNSIEISWKKNTESPINKYELEYADNPDFMNSVTVSNIEKTNYLFDNLESNKTYYWRVRSQNEINYSDYSFNGYFTTDIVTNVKTEGNITSFKLEQNYPNPFNPATVINYELPVTGYIQLKIYDMIGSEVTTLVSKEQQAGKYSVIWNAEKYSSGVYYYELKSGDVRIVKKMILTK